MEKKFSDVLHTHKFHTKNCTFYYSKTKIEVTISNNESWDFPFYNTIIKFHSFLGLERESQAIIWQQSLTSTLEKYYRPS